MQTKILLGIVTFCIIILIFLLPSSFTKVIIIPSMLAIGALYYKKQPEHTIVGNGDTVWKIIIVDDNMARAVAIVRNRGIATHRIDVFVKDRESYKNLPSYITIFINHVVPLIAPRSSYNSALTFLYREADAEPLNADDESAIANRLVTLLGPRFDYEMVFKMPYFMAYPTLVTAIGSVNDIKVNRHVVSEAMYLSKKSEVFKAKIRRKENVKYNTEQKRLVDTQLDLHKKQPPTSILNYNQSYIFNVKKTDIPLNVSLKSGQPWEKILLAIMSAFVEPDSVVLDIGSNIGTMAIPLSRAVNGDCLVYGFEPYPTTWFLLKGNIVENKCKNVIPVAACVGHKNIPSVGMAPEHPASSMVMQLGEGKDYKVPMITIDGMGISGKVSLIKVDVEGSEALALYGALETINRDRPVIVYERNTAKLSDATKASLNIPNEVDRFDIVTYCRGIGYNSFYLLGRENFMLVPPGRTPHQGNALFTPEPTTLVELQQTYKRYPTFVSTHPIESLTGYDIFVAGMPYWKVPEGEEKKRN